MLALKLTHGGVFSKLAMTYLTSQLNLMETQEATKIFFALTQKKGALVLTDVDGQPDIQTYQFLAYMGHYFSINLARFDDKSMAFLLSMLANNPPNLSANEQNKENPVASNQTGLQKAMAETEMENEKFLSPDLIRQQIERVFKQQNFSVQNFTTILGAAFDIMSRPEHNVGIERKELPCREDLDFWVTCVTYIPRLRFESQSQVV